ncbi:MAG: FtsH protease activity modulator HflK [Parvularculaceae bacterium]
MPWSDNSGKGGPAKGPWGQPPNKGNGGGGRNEPPDLEELLQASRQRLKRAFPRGGKGGGGGGVGSGGRGIPINSRTLAIGGGVLIALWIFSGMYQVGPQEQGVTTTFGKFTGITGPGLHWRAPMIQGVTLVPVDAQQTATVGGGGQAAEENLMLTSDRNIVDVSFSVDWKIKREPPQPGEFPNAAKFIFNIENPEGLVKAVAESAMRETIGSNRLDPIITSGQAEVVEQTRQRIQATLDFHRSGIEVLRVNLNRPQAPQAVRDAFVDVIRARSEQQQLINEAEKAANQIIPVAQGDAQKLIEESRAYAARVVADSIGQAERFNKIYEEYRRAPEVTRQRMYLETVESVLGDMNKIVIDESVGAGVVPYLPLNELTKKN